MLQPSGRTKIYDRQVFTKLSASKYAALLDKAQDAGRTVSEYLRGLILTDIERSESVVEARLSMLEELVQSVRTDHLTALRDSRIVEDVREFALQSEEQVSSQLDSFRGRFRDRRGALKGLNNGE